MAMYGLKPKLTLNDVIHQFQTERNPIKYPDRTATFVRNSFELSQLDGEGMREMEEQQARQMAEVAKEHAIRDLARNSNVSHVALSEQAKALTRNASIQALIQPTSSDQGTQRGGTTLERGTQRGGTTLEKGTQRGGTTTDKGTQRGGTTTDKETQRGGTTTDKETQGYIQTTDRSIQNMPQQTSTSSQTLQEFDIAQGDRDVEMEQPHLQDRRAQMLEQENDALKRELEREMMIAERQKRLILQHEKDLQELSKRHEQEKDNAMREVLRSADARLASVQSQAGQYINQQQQEHARQIASIEAQAEQAFTEQQKAHRKQMEDFEQDAQRQIHHKGKHSTTPTMTSEKDKKPKLEKQEALPSYSH